MAESTLNLDFEALQKMVGDYLGFGRTPGNWSSDETDRVDEYIQSGVRNFYRARDWTFLRPITSIVLWGAIAVDSAVTVASSDYDGTNSTVTVTGGTPFVASMVGASIVITDIGTFTINSFTSSSVVVVTGDATCSGKTFAMTPDGSYRLPDDFGGLDGDPTWDPDDWKGSRSARKMNEAMLRELLTDGTTGQPNVVAYRPLTQDGTGQRFELLAYPIPDSNYTLHYRYRVLPGKLTTGNYIYGSADHAECIKAACLAQAELYGDDTKGIHSQNFTDQLARSIGIDEEVAESENYGYNHDRESRMMGRTIIGYGNDYYVVNRE